MHALRCCPVVELTDQAVDTTPTPVADETVVPFMNHMAVLPLVSRHSKSALPWRRPSRGLFMTRKPMEWASIIFEGPSG
jgi:hypothetical protein